MENKDKLVSDESIDQLAEAHADSKHDPRIDRSAWLDSARAGSFEVGALYIRDLYEEELRKLRELIPYAQHKDTCISKMEVSNGLGLDLPECSCGLQEKLDALTK